MDAVLGEARGADRGPRRPRLSAVQAAQLAGAPQGQGDLVGRRASLPFGEVAPAALDAALEVGVLVRRHEDGVQQGLTAVPVRLLRGIVVWSDRGDLTAALAEQAQDVPEGVHELTPDASH